MISLPEQSLCDLIGRELMTRSPFQWVKLFGRQNCISFSPVVIDRAYIRREAFDCIASGRTSNALANVLCKFYVEWAYKHEFIRGMLAELVHFEVMTAISKAHKISWIGGDLKNPYKQFMGYFDSILSNVQYRFLLDPGERKNVGVVSVARKLQGQNRLFRCMARAGYLGEGLDDNSRALVFCKDDFDWSFLQVETPEDILISAGL